MKKKRGVALIVVIGILTVLALAGTTFLIRMRLAHRSAQSYYDGFKGRMTAEAGIERAIAELRRDFEGGDSYWLPRVDSLTDSWASGYVYMGSGTINGSILTDTGVPNWATNSLVGCYLNPNLDISGGVSPENPGGFVYRIIANTATTITVDSTGPELTLSQLATGWSGNKEFAVIWNKFYLGLDVVPPPLNEGIFDLRYARTIEGDPTLDEDGDRNTSYEVHTQLDETASGEINGHVVRGVIDEDRKININTANPHLLEGLFEVLVSAGIYSRGEVIQRIANIVDYRDAYENPYTYTSYIDGTFTRTGKEIDGSYNAKDSLFATVAEINAVRDIGPAAIYGQDDGSPGGTENNHVWENFTGGENNVGGVGNLVLQGGIEDLITIYSPGIYDSGIENVYSVASGLRNILYNSDGTEDADQVWDTEGDYNISPVNVNTAGVTVLRAVIGGIMIDATNYISSTDRDAVVNAIIAYRNGADGIEGTLDDNPFDGIDSNPTDGIDPNYTQFQNDGIDNDGDGLTDEADEGQVFLGGARSEFEELISYLISSGYSYVEWDSDSEAWVNSTTGTISLSLANDIKDNANPDPYVDYDGDGNDDNSCWTTPFKFESGTFQITASGRLIRGIDEVSGAKVTRIIRRTIR